MQEKMEINLSATKCEELKLVYNSFPKKVKIVFFGKCMQMKNYGI